MKNFIALLIIVIFVIVNIDSASAQLKVKTSKKKPLIMFDISGSLDVATLNLQGANLEEFWALGNYGQSVGYGGEFKFKVSALTRKMTQLRPYLAIGYAHFTRDEVRLLFQLRNFQ